MNLLKKNLLLGVKITTDLIWSTNPSDIIKKAYNKIWMIRRMKLNRANKKKLLDVYCINVRNVHPSLTQINTKVYKAAFAIILGKE